MDNSLPWIVFSLSVLFLIILDMGLLRRRRREMTVKSSLWLSGVYILAACLFGLWVMSAQGAQAGKDFFTGYVIEKSLSLDNIFIMSLVFGALSIPESRQSRVLFWGIAGVILLRGILIGGGAVLLHHFHGILYVFGALLIYGGAKMLLKREEKEVDMEESRLMAWLRRKIHVTRALHGEKFFVRLPQTNQAGRLGWQATPLFLALLFIEFADIVFALDSVPAVFGVTTDGFIVYTSNIFAVLGLRALYFALTTFLNRFVYLHITLALILIFIGAKIFLPLAGWHISSGLSLGVTLLALAGGVIASTIASKRA